MLFWPRTSLLDVGQLLVGELELAKAVLLRPPGLELVLLDLAWPWAVDRSRSDALIFVYFVWREPRMKIVRAQRGV